MLTPDACCALLRCAADRPDLDALLAALGKVADLPGGPRLGADLAGCTRAEGGCTEPDPSSG